MRHGRELGACGWLSLRLCGRACVCVVERETMWGLRLRLWSVGAWLVVCISCHFHVFLVMRQCTRPVIRFAIGVALFVNVACCWHPPPLQLETRSPPCWAGAGRVGPGGTGMISVALVVAHGVVSQPLLPCPGHSMPGVGVGGHHGVPAALKPDHFKSRVVQSGQSFSGCLF